MACPGIHISSMLMVFLLLINGSFSRPSVKIANNELTEICSTTQDPSFCVQALKSDPRTANADLKGLAQISIDLAKASATKTTTLITSLVEKANDPKLKGRYETCAENYDDSISSLDDCTQSVSSRDYVSLNFQASAAMDGPVTCLDSFEGPPKDPSELPTKSEDLIHLCSIILAISKRLIG
ncbi:hypothetical protein AAG906_038402 [Vitis piasezkii]|uniref:Pectinesterase inhibitor domain-containing protein n=1 Tax=Vitis vinifera TaxID=29760 RepID=A0ABY9D8A8_VITVI|nr:pectinesterase inhibitor-like [Vitis vinifera]WKA03621.1 hypothetical protein VitviT2T_021721 [Vitis vinifera]|eukprot:XP_010660323.1 PREDICTED: pectinesterase inhibitor-like [Vitis vinifera]